jgi:predicted transcriptional regulator
VVELETRQGIEKLFFELASESRLSILRKLEGENLKLNEIARRLDLTPTETFRQLQRLTDVLLVAKLPEGSYGITQVGKLVVRLVRPFELVFEEREYFLTHDFWRLPSRFIETLGALSGAILQTETIEAINRGSQMVKEAKEYFWGMGESHGLTDSATILTEQVCRGVKFRFISPKSAASSSQSPPIAVSQSFEVKNLNDIPAIVLLNENMAALSLRSVNGKLDYTGFFGNDPVFHRWVKDLFRHYWQLNKQLSQPQFGERKNW